MQNKGFIRIFAIALTLVCLFYLSFSVVTRRYAAMAEEVAAGDMKKKDMYLDSLSSEKVWLGYTLKECREMEINLGLDLKGGMNVILELSVGDVLKALAPNSQDENFQKAIAAANIRNANGEKDYIKVFVDELRKLDPNVSLAGVFSSYELKDRITPKSTDAEVIAVLEAELEGAISNSFNVLRTRIDRFGVVSPNIQRLEQAGRISVELPGVKDPKRVESLLRGSANLEFWETYELGEIINNLSQVNAISEKLATAAPQDTTATVAVATEDSTVAKEGDNKEQALTALLDSAKTTSKEATTAAPASNALFSKLQINTYNGQLGSGPLVGMAHYRDTATINAYLGSRQARDILPRDLQFRWSVKAIDDKDQIYQLIALKASNRNGEPALGGNVVTDARADFGQNTSNAEVSMSMNSEGAKNWARITRENKGRCVAIVLDGYVYSFPRVNDEITGGNSQITGNFTPEEAKDLANVLKSGKMAASIKIINEEVVGPSLGQEAIRSGIISFIIALALLMLYMMSFYGIIPGMIANLGLIVNLFFTMGILASFQSVLTLSGIAGLVLSLGVAVDANVLIYERTREELRNGMDIRRAIISGYDNAFSAIFDSNLTSIITGFILFIFGTGPIKGFATTLIIGLFVSFFTSVFLTRLIYETGLAKGKFLKLPFETKLSKGFFVGKNYDWVGKRKYGYVFSAILLVVMVGTFFFRGLNMGIDFTGGRNYILQFENTVNPQELADQLKPEFGDASLNVINVTNDRKVRISTNYKVAEDGTAVEKEIEGKIYKALQSKIPNGMSEEEFSSNIIQYKQKVGPAIAKDITVGAVWAVLLSMICMGLYIFIRFKNIAFSYGAIASLVHDTVIIIGLYALLHGFMPFSMEIDQSFIAAILTVIGYSVNDTVVVFDRVREILGIYPNRDRKSLINEALNSTLPRTINTSLSTAIVLLCIFFFGADSIRSFTFAMIVGIFFGTYSTLFIAIPVAYETDKKKRKKAAKLSTAK